MTRTQLLKLFQKIRPRKIPSKHTHIYVSKLGAYSNQKWTGVTRPGHFYQRQERTFQSTSTDRQSDRSIDRSIVRGARQAACVHNRAASTLVCALATRIRDFLAYESIDCERVFGSLATRGSGSLTMTFRRHGIRPAVDW